MKSIETLMRKAMELKEKGLTDAEIADELHLSIPTITWLLTRNVEDTSPPADVKIGWRSIGIYGHRIGMLATLFSDIIAEELGKRGESFDTIVGIAINGIPFSTLIAEELECEMSIYRPPACEDAQGTFMSNYASLEGKKVVLIDDVLSTGGTMMGAIAGLQEQKATPVLVLVLVNKTDMNDLHGVPLRSLIRARTLK